MVNDEKKLGAMGTIPVKLPWPGGECGKHCVILPEPTICTATSLGVCPCGVVEWVGPASELP